MMRSFLKLKTHKLLSPLFALAVIPTVCLLLMSFSDLPEDHWAYGAVNRLVEDGTVGGYGDGTFRPESPVTRAEFVKMLGYRTQQPRTDFISDLNTGHWAFEFLLYSPLRTVERQILPDEYISREQVAVYMYDCYGQNRTSNAPSVITNGLAYPDEIGWVYEHGILNGDDGFTLRLNDGLTRAEAATLIVNSRDKMTDFSNFADKVSQSALQQVFDDSALFDTPYSADTVLTNGEIARAANRLRQGRIGSLWYGQEPPFEHQYAGDLAAFESILGAGRISAEFADAPALPEDAYAMLAYGVASKIRTPVAYGTTGDYYTDAQPASSTLDAPLTFAYRNGILPYAQGKLNTGTPVTHQSVAAVLLQYDLLWGLETAVTVDGQNLVERDAHMRYTGLPANYGLFQAVLDGIPNVVYDTPLMSPEGDPITPGVQPRVNFAFCSDLRSFFGRYLNANCAQIKADTGVSLCYTYYPQLVYDNYVGLVLRVKAEITDPGEAQIQAQQLFGDYILYTESTAALAAGDVVWLEVPMSYEYFAG